MKQDIKKNIKFKKGFTLAEALAATAILALVSSSVWLIIERCVDSTANSIQKMRAFEVARENMETLLTKNFVNLSAEYGTSDKYPEVTWETVVETFYEPVHSQMWVRGICKANYVDSKGQEQFVELVHWLTGLTKEELLLILMKQEDQQEELTSQLMESIEEAAIYAGVSSDTIQQWMNNGMFTTEDGFFIKNNLDLFKQYKGNPSIEDKRDLQVRSEEELKKIRAKQNRQEWKDEIDPKTGLTYGEIDQMDISEIWDILQHRRQE